MLNKLEKQIANCFAIALTALTIHSVNTSKIGSGDPIKRIEPPPVAKKYQPISLPQYCFPSFQRLTLDTYNLCIYEGMSYQQVANVIGNSGQKIFSKGGFATYSWGGTGDVMSLDGQISVNFVNNKLNSKLASC